MLLRLTNTVLSVAILPEAGGGLAAFEWLARGEAKALMRPYSPTDAVPTGLPDPNWLACYPLLPWSNRIGDGGFISEGRRVELALNRNDDAFPIHGSGWQRAWQVSENDEHAALLTLQETQPGGYNYRASQRYALDGSTMQVDLSITNTGDWTMPFGLGLHPFFLRHGDVLLHAPASKVWINDGRTPMPTGRVEVPEAWDFRDLRLLPDEGVNHAFQPWNGQADIVWPQLGLRLRICADADTFVLYTPEDGEFFCFEPVDHPINAVHLPGGATANGMTALKPGETLARRFVFELIDEGAL